MSQNPAIPIPAKVPIRVNNGIVPARRSSHTPPKAKSATATAKVIPCET